MKRSLVIGFLFIWGMVVRLPLYPQMASPVPSLDSTTVARLQALCLQHRTGQADSLLDSLLQHNPDNPELLTLRAYCLVQKGGMDNRFAARALLRKIHRIARNRLFYQFVWAELYRAQGFTGMARRQYEKVLRQNPDFVPALVALGEIHLHEMLRYYYRYTDTEIPLSFREYAIDDYDLAVNYLHHAMRLDSTNQRAAVLLGNLYYEAEEYEKMVRLFSKMVRRVPNSRDFYLFLGLAYHALGNYSAASQAFQKALAHMPEDQRRIFLSPGLLTGEGPGSAAADTTDRFWKKKDPLFLTPENERLLEHISRVAYAQMRFGVPALHVEGWQTDRGRTYIRYGRPQYIVEYGKSMEWGAIYPPQQIWVYPDFQLSFSDEFWNGEFRFTQPMPRSKSVFKERTRVDYNLVARDVFATKPERFEFKRSGGTVQADYRLYAFADSAGAYFWVPFRMLVKREHHRRHWFRTGFFWLDSTGVPTRSVVDSFLVTFPLEPGQSRDHFYYRAFARIPLPEWAVPGSTIRYALEIWNRTRDASFSRRSEVMVPDFSDDSLSLSSVVVSRHVEPATGGDPLVRHHLRIFPEMEGHFSRQDTLFIYFEVYHLTPDVQGEYHYEVENSLSPAGRSGWLKWFRRSSRRVAVVNEYSSRTPTDVVVQSFRPEHLPPGKYILEIRVRDTISGMECRKKLPIFLIQGLTD